METESRKVYDSKADRQNDVGNDGADGKDIVSVLGKRLSLSCPDYFL